jgi:hypothetical protein
MPVAAELLNLITKLHARAFNRVPGSAIVAPTNEAVSPMHRPKRLLQLDINYRWSPIVLDERKHHDAHAMIRAGDRAPEVNCLTEITGAPERGSSRSLFGVFAKGLHTILVFWAGDAETLGDGFALFRQYISLGIANVVVICPRQSTTISIPRDLGVQILVDTGTQGFSGYSVDTDKNTFGRMELLRVGRSRNSSVFR